MAANIKDIWKLLDTADHHARATLRTNTEIRSLLSTIAIRTPAKHPCPKCKLELGGPESLAHHLANVHDGPPVPLTDQELAA